MFNAGARHDDLLDELAFLTRGHAVIDEVVFQRHGAAGFALAQDDLRAEGDQQGRRVTNRRGVADVAAQGALVADLQGREAVQQFTEVRVLGVQGLVAIGQGRGGADFQAIVKAVDALHLGDVADVDHHRQGAVELRDFQRQVRTAGQQAGLWISVVEIGQIGHGQRHQAALVAAVQFPDVGRRDGFEASNGFGFTGIELIRFFTAAGLLGGFQNRPVAGAAAEVAGQRFVSLGMIRCIAVLLQGKQRHHETGSAEAALRAVALDHGFLHAVQFAFVLEVFNADELFAVQRRNERQARVEAAIANVFATVIIGLQFANHHGARAAVTAGAAFFGAGFAHMVAQIIEHGQVRVQGVLATEFLV
ncbi:hypothetical protein D3C71_1120760 [compost metagenome]